MLVGQEKRVYWFSYHKEVAVQTHSSDYNFRRPWDGSYCVPFIQSNLNCIVKLFQIQVHASCRSGVITLHYHKMMVWETNWMRVVFRISAVHSHRVSNGCLFHHVEVICCCRYIQYMRWKYVGYLVTYSEKVVGRFIYMSGGF